MSTKSENKPVTITCIKWGDKFPAYYVNRLYAGIKRHIDRPFRFVCFTEDATGIRNEVEIYPLPVVPIEDEIVTAMTTGKRRGAWRKVTIFKKGEGDLSGPCLQLDLDVVISGPVGPLFDYMPDKLCMAHDWLEKRRGKQGGQGSVIRFNADKHNYLYDDFAADIAGSVALKGEQRYTSFTALKHGDLEYFPDGWIMSFKRHAIPIFPLNFLVPPSLPKDAHIVCFHGTPKMEEALTGDCPKIRYRTRPAQWLRELWLEENEQNWMPG